eukprot:TRINITY_DN676_c1_g1_i1.p1 TRINITY_DN676_c1_g1~~TRINITY_DN676_c1_g1_i1.p1  ORF type:complete len:444 (+),score=18.39 TRINITY_DN676_c1_g1_i1:114-1445(+)
MEENLTLEEIRARNIAENAAFLAQMGFSSGIPLIASQIVKTPKVIRPYQRKPKSNTPTRRSDRVSGQEAPKYNDRYVELDDPDRPRHRPVKRTKLEVNSRPSEGVLMPALSENGREVYYEKHVKLLGTCAVVWPHCNFIKTYDKEHGTSCHQCRQKTVDPKTSCSRCHSGYGVFCGTCLQHRYGENIDEVKLRTDWICPRCRGFCNCSICRVRAGLLPTGIAVHTAAARGYPSVAHYHVNKYLRPGPCPEDDVLAMPAQITATGEEEATPSNECTSDESTDSWAIVPYGVEAEVESVGNDEMLMPPGSIAASPIAPNVRRKVATKAANFLPLVLAPCPLPSTDLQPGHLVACRPDSRSGDKVWIAEVIKMPESPSGRHKPNSFVAVKWFELDTNFDKEVYRKTKLTDIIPADSIFYSGFKLKKRLTQDGRRWQPMEDLSKHDV